MKKKIFGAVVVVAIAVGAMINVNLNKNNSNGDLALTNVEALAEGEIGPLLTNWKEQTFTCQRTTGIDFYLVYMTTVTYTKVGCGYGTGYCLSPAGC